MTVMDHCALITYKVLYDEKKFSIDSVFWLVDESDKGSSTSTLSSGAFIRGCDWFDIDAALTICYIQNYFALLSMLSYCRPCFLVLQ
jgi:hypothetical protein